MKRIVIASFLILEAQSPSSAYVADNHTWNLTCNASGYEKGVASTATEETETLYLGKSCDASHKIFGKGKWCWANGGFRAEFENKSIGFPRQELLCPNEADEISGCGC